MVTSKHNRSLPLKIPRSRATLTTSARRAQVSFSGTGSVALTAGEQAVWVSDSRGQLWRINPDTGTVTQTTPVGGGLVGICATDGLVLAANNADGTVVRIDPQDGRVVGLVPVGHAPTDVVSWDGTIWVSIQSESAM